jgi:hypothetical protein
MKLLAKVCNYVQHSTQTKKSKGNVFWALHINVIKYIETILKVKRVITIKWEKLPSDAQMTAAPLFLPQV